MLQSPRPAPPQAGPSQAAFRPVGTAPVGQRQTGPTRPNPALIKRRRQVFFGSSTFIILAVGAATAFAWPGYAIPEPEIVELAITVPQPKPTITPAAREGEQTALVKAIPDVVHQWVQNGVSGNSDWQKEAYAVEAWNVNYLDGATKSGQRVKVIVGQWSSDSEAAQFYRKQKAAVKVAATNVNNVLVGEQIVGEYALFDTGGGLGEIWWRNGTVVVKASGPVAELADFYTAYRL